MIRMPPFPVGQYYDPGPSFANDRGYLQAVLVSIFDTPIGNIERSPPTCFQNLRRIGSFAGAVVGAAPRPHLTLGQVEDSRALAMLRPFQQRAATGLLHVVAVRRDRQDVEGLARGEGRHVSRDCPAQAPRSRARSAGAPPFPSVWAVRGSRVRRCRRK